MRGIKVFTHADLIGIWFVQVCVLVSVRAAAWNRMQFVKDVTVVFSIYYPPHHQQASQDQQRRRSRLGSATQRAIESDYNSHVPAFTHRKKNNRISSTGGICVTIQLSQRSQSSLQSSPLKYFFYKNTHQSDESETKHSLQINGCGQMVWALRGAFYVERWFQFQIMKRAEL